MRKIILAVAVLAMTTFATSCNGFMKSADSANDSICDSTEALAFDSIEVSDSIILSKIDKVEASVKCVYPVSGEQCLVDSIISWINNDVLVDNNGKSLANSSEDLERNVRNVVREYLRTDSIEADDMIRTNRMADIDSDMPVEYDRSLEVEVAYEDDDYVTMSYNIFMYMAGAAHGSTIAACVTFSKKDGHRVEWELTSAYSKDELTKLMKEGLKKYFGAKSDEELREYLLDIDEHTYNTAFPMPQTPPYILKDGIHLTYQQYEIGPYAAGMPDVTVAIK